MQTQLITPYGSQIHTNALRLALAPALGIKVTTRTMPAYSRATAEAGCKHIAYPVAGQYPDNAEPITVYSPDLRTTFTLRPSTCTVKTFNAGQWYERRERRGMTHRLYATCNCCKREIPAGKMRQHYKHKHADILASDMQGIRERQESERQAQAHKRAIDLVCVGVDSREPFIR